MGCKNCPINRCFISQFLLSSSRDLSYSNFLCHSAPSVRSLHKENRSEMDQHTAQTEPRRDGDGQVDEREAATRRRCWRPVPETDPNPTSHRRAKRDRTESPKMEATWKTSDESKHNCLSLNKSHEDIKKSQVLPPHS